MKIIINENVIKLCGCDNFCECDKLGKCNKVR